MGEPGQGRGGGGRRGKNEFWKGGNGSHGRGVSVGSGEEVGVRGTGEVNGGRWGVQLIIGEILCEGIGDRKRGRW